LFLRSSDPAFFGTAFAQLTAAPYRWHASKIQQCIHNIAQAYRGCPSPSFFRFVPFEWIHFFNCMMVGDAHGSCWMTLACAVLRESPWRFLSCLFATCTCRGSSQTKRFFYIL